MSMWDEVFESLRTMNVWQLLFAFVSCTGYAVAQGSLVRRPWKWGALGLALVAALGFVLESERWVDGFMLMAIAVGGLGLFAALVWLVSRLLGLTAKPGSPPGDTLPSLPPSEADGAPGHAQAIGTPPRTAASH